MARPTKWRRVEFMPCVYHFIPSDVASENLKENILRIEEIEAIRLKDYKGFNQEECAEKMQISRQTYQRILNTAREKVADSLINGKAIRIEGGSFTRNICPVRCLNCGKEWNESYENFQKIVTGKYNCPDCSSSQIICSRKDNKKFCKNNCRWRKSIKIKDE